MKNLEDMTMEELKAELKQEEDEASRWDVLQNARKVQLNSVYGAMGNPYFRFYDLRHAEAITLSGQLLIRWVARDLNAYINRISGTVDVDYVIAIDTDSNYLDFGPFVRRAMPNAARDEIVDALSQFIEDKVQPVINKAFKDLCDHLNAHNPDALYMKRESISDAGVFMAKKRYILNVLDNEGVRYENGNLKIMGLEAVKSSTPAMCRDWLKKIYPIFLHGDQKTLQDEVTRLREFHSSLKPHETGFNRGVSEVERHDAGNGQVGKGAPINSRAAVVYNHAIKKNGLDNKYPLIQDGDKMHFIMLKTPNPISSNVIGWSDDWPTELGLDKFVDRDGMFSKTFQDAIEPIAKVMGWDVVEKPRLDWMFE
jgi:DNA polymerase elongation subunit (family B)